MNCVNHRDRESVEDCESCGNSLCAECAIPIKGEPYCKTCVSGGQFKEKEPPRAQPTQTQAQPQYPYGYQYPYPYQYQYQYSYPYYQTAPTYQYRRPKKDGTGTIVTSGTMLLMVGILGLISPLIMFSMYLPSIPLFGVKDLTASSWIFLCFVLPFIFSIITMLGAFALLRHKNYQMGLIGAFFGVFTWGFYFGSIISIFILIVLLSSYDDIVKKPEVES
jgi:hypothetical protein